MTESRSLAVIQAGIFFDRTFYITQNPDVASQEDLDPLEHFLVRGALEGRDPHILFNSSFYLEQNPNLAREQINPLVHFMSEGARQGLDPHPLFSTSYYLDQGISMEDCNGNPLIHYLSSGAKLGLDPHPLFNSSFYLNRLQELGLKDLPENPLVHYLSNKNNIAEPSPLFDGASYISKYPDLAESGINPLLHYVHVGQYEGRFGLRLTNLSTDLDSFESQEFKKARCLLQDAAKDSFSILIIISCLLRGGYERCASNFAQALAQSKGINDILFLVTDLAEIKCQDWLPEGARIVNLAQLAATASTEEKALLLLDLIARKQPSTVFAINAPVFWSALDTQIGAWENHNFSTRIIAYLGSYEHYVSMNNHGFLDGELHRLIEKVDLFITDTFRMQTTMRLLKKHIPSIETKVVACYKSLGETLHQTLSSQSRIDEEPLASKSDAAKILWASRIETFKCPEILAEIASRMPHVKFEVYGRISPDYNPALLESIPNIEMHGEYSDFSAIPKENIAAFLYTTKVDGMPHVLLEAGACALPVIAPAVGGIEELIDDSTGWLIENNEDIDKYVYTIEYILAHRQSARKRAQTLQARINQRHTWPEFLKRVEALDITNQSNH